MKSKAYQDAAGDDEDETMKTTMKRVVKKTGHTVFAQLAT